MKKMFTPFSLRMAFLAFVFSGLATQASASHLAGFDLRYECLGGNDYRITLSMYRDCMGINAPSSCLLTLSSATCGLNMTATATLDTFYEQSPLPPAMWYLSACNGGNLPGIEVYFYTADVTLTGNCADWLVQYNECCRNCAVTNFANACSSDMLVQARIDNTNGLCNNSPQFSSLPVSWVCDSQLVSYNHGAYDPDGDSLAFSMVVPVGFGAVPLAYNPPFNLANPFGMDGNGMSFNPLTGQMDFVPIGIQVALVSVLVEEYRNGLLIGSTWREMEFYVSHCDSNNVPMVQRPDITGGAVLFEPDALGAGGVFRVQPNTQFTFSMVASDPDVNQSLMMESNIELAIPGSMFLRSGNNPVEGQFMVAPVSSPRYFEVTVRDNAMPIVNQRVTGFAVFPDAAITGISEPGNLTSLLVSPQPMAANSAWAVQLSSDVAGMGRFEIYAADGRLVRAGSATINAGQQGIVMEGIPQAGIYTLRVTLPGGGYAHTRVLVF